MLISSIVKNTAGSPPSVEAGGWMARGRAGGHLDRIRAWTKDAAEVESTAGSGSTAGRWPLAVASGAPRAAEEGEGPNAGVRLGGAIPPRAAGEEEGPNGGKALDQEAASAKLGGVAPGSKIGGGEGSWKGGEGSTDKEEDSGEISGSHPLQLINQTKHHGVVLRCICFVISDSGGVKTVPSQEEQE
ncbi:hypothetical protein Taro_055278 [Colocasia esculenta]|uniref:Uncharacterized protein n=1 Tax=Colocasia esculenta TaxID=4460 RepID=A0A843XQK8_COLES|nr:hypothetical protein [Colocasia esculenta]